MMVQLRGNTQKGRNRIREAGTDLWEVSTVADFILASKERGPWMLVHPEGHENMSRWVRMKGDFHFKVVKLFIDPEEFDLFNAHDVVTADPDLP